MDDNNKTLNSNDDNIQLDSSTSEQTTEEESKVEETVATESKTEETETGESKKGAQSRIRELNTAKKAAEEEARSLRDQLSELTRSSRPQTYNSESKKQEYDLNEDGTVNIEAYRQRILSEANAQTQLQIRQSEAISRINQEANEVIREYPELDPKSENFNKELSDSITEATEAYVKSNPYSASVSKFVAKLMKPYQKAIEKEVGQASENIAKQVSRAAIRPTSVRKPEKSARDKTLAELEQELGVVQS